MTKEASPRFPILLRNTAVQGLGFDEEKTRGAHQGWEATVFPEKAVYMSATESHLVTVTDCLAKGDGPYMLRNSPMSFQPLL